METVDINTLAFFAGKPEALRLYQAFAEKVCGRFSEVRIKAQKTQITFSNRHVFACVSLARVRRKAELPPVYIVVTLGLPAPLESDRVAVKTEPYPGRWTHHVLVASEAELDDELMEWIGQAYAFSEIK